MVTDLHRRHALAVLGGLGACAIISAPAFAQAGDRVHLAAAWERQGRFHIGLLSTQGGAGQALQVHAALEVPTRAHGLAVLPDGSVLTTARRPGDWLVRWRPGQRAQPQWLWQNGERSFNGHVLASADGTRLYTTETDIETGASWIGVRDARTLEQTAEWPTHGIDAHELVWDGAGALIVANGGVPTAPETGRVKRDLDRMDSSLVRLDAHTGRLLGQWRLQDPRLSLRHLAWSPGGHGQRLLGIALQAEHDDATAKDTAPVLALFDGTALRAMSAPQPLAQSLHGYGGSIAATPAGWAVSCPRAHGIATFSLPGTWQRLVPLPEVCPLAVRGSALWAGGLAGSLQDAQAQAPLHHPHDHLLQGARLDNHWVAV
ncbi:MAG: DUF1513 domain-containing protein [Burkholderiaceae bacterium]|nr:MAG: DUF1513 domain-containing protein [Burkholderiaceae bacterium]